ncbi:uncharacterized protein LOC129747800 [Uranotaenia lowii]|uniref:uncharacterized protein LOC129747763 n=1 Tax=Uranotaenia lowii TaxID=190385 RepID=UPI00247B0749|nr:uncharacterized protein LOC129747763 [Uranotaenia lowii]XP_055598130.1 uncharacterized protein LOC129747800 [Uranotaenia lowii]
MKLLLVIVLLGVFNHSAESGSVAFGSRCAGDKLLYSWRLSSGPLPEPGSITLHFDYSTSNHIFEREYFTQIEFERPDDLIPNGFVRNRFNSSFMEMWPIRLGVTEWWLQGNLYGFDSEPFPDNCSS